MIFKRILHPVGQGAFFSEQFFDENDEAVFNVVYDCGEKRTTKHLVHEIDNTFALKDKPEVIDVMFISHLDEDHFNGIDHLITQGCLTEKSVVILPLLYPLVVKEILERSRAANGKDSYGMYDCLLSLFDSGAKILGVDDNEEVYPNDPLRIEKVLSDAEPYTTIKSKQPLQYGGLWCYLPFNTILDDDRYEKFLKALKDNGIKKDKLSDINYVKDNIPTLKKIYEKLPSGIGSVTAINVNSLNVLSYAAKGLKCHGEWWNYFGHSNGWWWPEEVEILPEGRFSCLYTGDCVMESNFNTCLDFIKQHILPYIGLLQIPHHGRSTCYNKAVVQRKDIYLGFTNFNSTHKANKFVKQIMHDFSIEGKEFFQITEHFHSRMEFYMRIG